MPRGWYIGAGEAHYLENGRALCSSLATPVGVWETPRHVGVVPMCEACRRKLRREVQGASPICACDHPRDEHELGTGKCDECRCDYFELPDNVGEGVAP